MDKGGASLRMIGRSILALFAAAWLGGALPSHAETLHVGAPAANVFDFLPLRVGMQKGFFAKYGLEIEAIDFQGGAKLQQAMIAGSIDMAVSGGTDIAFIAKGAPELAVAAMSGPPLGLGVIVPYDSPAKTADDLKGMKVGVTTVGSLTEWLVRRLMQQKGWGPNDVTVVPAGSIPAETAALATGHIDAMVAGVGLGFQLELSKRGRLLFPFSDIVHEFLNGAIFASSQIIHDNPDAVRRFLKGWFENIAFMRANKAEAAEIVRTFTKFDPEVESRQYDLVMPMFSTTGKFEPGALTTLQESFVEMGVFATKPDLSKLYTEKFLPGR